ncbi:hypothetical protein M5X17_31205 [Paenibacillus alvei]|uniref:hypothetical protein n=1 Tax=Paenibacillus alvei TaxID=44250 RepID=UPI00227FF94A|nr:hypothetical protein [Paenibacillus alvei]MCY9738162.1 hypothetical protein [Paenibacillus alvei]
MTKNLQKEILKLYELYNSTDQQIIKKNLKSKFTERGLKQKFLAEILNITEVSAKPYFTLTHKTKPDLVNLIKIAEFMEFNICDLFENIEEGN